MEPTIAGPLRCSRCRGPLAGDPMKCVATDCTAGPFPTVSGVPVLVDFSLLAAQPRPLRHCADSATGVVFLGAKREGSMTPRDLVAFVSGARWSARPAPGL